jgi:hypothetical protein
MHLLYRVTTDHKLEDERTQEFRLSTYTRSCPCQFFKIHSTLWLRKRERSVVFNDVASCLGYKYGEMIRTWEDRSQSKPRCGTTLPTVNAIGWEWDQTQTSVQGGRRITTWNVEGQRTITKLVRNKLKNIRKKELVWSNELGPLTIDLCQKLRKTTKNISQDSCYQEWDWNSSL